ncbi:MAG: UDP-N-acetylmuramoyl-tripeptide--D-alanyl-D-alanine ligase [Phycisphaerae bacterium]|nr:UDP-N-acetylmuramoyl-tripeptide--D-alanyl-D-alanine ligase [Phycisphaerae bacterium]
MSHWTLDAIKAVIGGTWLARPESPPGPVHGACVDSRACGPGQVFFALRGERADGHSFLPDAAAAGAALAVVTSPEALPEGWRARIGPMAVLHTPDSGAALLRLAAAHRRRLDSTRVIAVGGSNGKTTTVRLLSAVLGSTLRGSASIKSFNNAVGVPLTILGANRSHQYLVCEVGTNAPGEIAPLAQVIAPDLAVITSVGREHLEGLATLAGVAAEEASLLGGLVPGGLAVLPAGVEALAGPARKRLAQVAGATAVTFGFGEDADLRVTDCAHERREGGVCLRFRVNAREWYDVPLAGRHNALNATAALAVARRLGVAPDAAREGLRRVEPAELRMQVARVPVLGGRVEVFNDAYNANPESMLAALETFAELAGGSTRRVAILGDMLELGDAAPDLHREIGEAIAAGDRADLVVTVGPLAGFIAERLSRSWPAERIVPIEDPAHAPSAARLLRAGDAVLLKGSRRMALERVAAALAADAPTRPAGAKGPAPTPATPLP